MHSGTPFAKKGGSELSLPSMDIPISLLEWEFFLPEQYKVKDFGGDAIAAYLLPAAMEDGVPLSTVAGLKENEGLDRIAEFTPGVSSGTVSGNKGAISGMAIDAQGAVIFGATVRAANSATGVVFSAQTDDSGVWKFNPLPAGSYKVDVSAQNFKTTTMRVRVVSGRETALGTVKLSVGSVSQTVEVTTNAPLIETTQAQISSTFSGDMLSTFAGVPEGGSRKDRNAKKQEALAQNGASSNVLNLQKRVAGVLPVRVDVPRAGTSYRFARALVLDEETKVTFNYKTK